MRPTPKCVIDRSRPCNACIAPDDGDSTGEDSTHPEE